MEPDIGVTIIETIYVDTERRLEQMRSEGLDYLMWVTSVDQDCTVHVRVAGLDVATRDRIVDVLSVQGHGLDLTEA